MITGRQLRDARSRSGLSQEELAVELGVTLRTIGNWERGAGVPSNREAKVRDALGDHLTPLAETPVDPLHAYSDTALVAEIARRLDAARGKGGQSDAGQAEAQKSPGVVPGLDGLRRVDYLRAAAEGESSKDHDDDGE